MGSLTQEWASTPKLSDSVMKMFDMAGKVAIVTGGSGGIGYEAARALAEAGSNIALWYSQANNTDKLAATIERDLGVKAMAYKCAVENFEEVRDQAAAVVRDFGRLDVIIANAGISRPRGIDDPVENWEQVIGVNLDGAYHWCTTVLKWPAKSSASKARETSSSMHQSQAISRTFHNVRLVTMPRRPE